MALKIVAIVQARMGSTRLPNKVMELIGGRSMIEILLHRLSKSKEVDKTVLATTTNPRDICLVEHVKSLGYSVFVGSENDVLDRYTNAARAHRADIVVRITGDCPLVDSELVDTIIQKFRDSSLDYLSNTNPPTFPDGLDVEVFTMEALEIAAKDAVSVYDREHVTPYLKRKGLFRADNLLNDEDLSSLRWTVDEKVDFQVIANVFQKFSPHICFSWKQVFNYQRENPEKFALNNAINRNEGASLRTGQKLWKRAKHVIPGGNMLLSKRPEMFLPDRWPSYFSKAKGCQVWDLDGNQYIDLSIMGIGTNILGYGHPEVDAAVHQVIDYGNMSTLNCPEEVYLAEKLVAMHPWAEMVRFARSGGEANAIAIRIARAATGRDGVAVCGYHGWHDWYLSANLGDDQNLTGHLLPGLEPRGVPRSLKGTVFPFQYNNIAQLEDIIKNHKIGVIKMEVMRNMEPENNFLKLVRDVATKNGIVLAFDECTSGFRETFGGLHKRFGVDPDIAMFGKALGNGYAITAVIGRKSVMEAAQLTFISSTFWTERIGPTAALRTLEVMEKCRSWITITERGRCVRRCWQELADEFHLKIAHWGIPALTGFSFESENALEYKTLISQEMLEKGFLASNSVYVSTEHTPEILDRYFEAIRPIFRLIAECESGRPVQPLLKGPVCHSGFKRLN